MSGHVFMKFSMVARVIGLLRVENLLYLRFSSHPTRTLLCHRPQDRSDSVDDASDRLTLQATVDDTGDKVATCLLRVRGRLPRRDGSCGGRLSGEVPVACLPFVPPCRPFIPPRRKVRCRLTFSFQLALAMMHLGRQKDVRKRMKVTPGPQGTIFGLYGITPGLQGMGSRQAHE